MVPIWSRFDARDKSAVSGEGYTQFLYGGKLGVAVHLKAELVQAVRAVCE
jgi:hypothetical protein